MNEEVLKNALELLYIDEFGKFSDAPPFKTSLKHDLAMKRIFRLYKKNTMHLRSGRVPDTLKTRLKLNRKTVVIIAVIVFLAVLAGCAAAYFISNGFRGEIHDKYTKIFVLNTENCPETIEEKYYIAQIPDGFEIIETQSSPYFEFTAYENKLTEQTIIFQQYAKSGFDSARLNTEKGVFEEIEINGHYGVYLNDSTDTNIHSCIIWDNGDYIIEITAQLPKIDIINLAKSTKLLEK